jgi:arylsulfatase A
MTLSVNGEVVATTQARSLVGRQPQENFCVGHDDARPVAAYHSKDRFEGKIEALKITTE